jgi:hypothetical protein
MVLGPSIKIGSFVCPLSSSSMFSSTPQTLVASSQVFSRIKNTLGSLLINVAAPHKLVGGPKGRNLPLLGQRRSREARLEHSPHLGNRDNKEKFCYCCLSPTHLIRSCTGTVRCRSYRRYGHIESFCLRRSSEVWRPKSRPNTEATPWK